ncbi:MAG: YraN family protein [bacterium]
MSRRDKKFGKWGEQQAVAFLRRNKFEIIETNYFTTRGEIDIIAKKDDDFYFVEVKSRIKGGLDDNTAITKQKMRRMRKTASKYCYVRDLKGVGIVFAGLMVVLDRLNRRIKFLFCVLYF